MYFAYISMFLLVFLFFIFLIMFVALCQYLIKMMMMMMKSGHVTITKIDNLHISKNAILFDVRRKITKLLRKNRLRHQALGPLESTRVVNTPL